MNSTIGEALLIGVWSWQYQTQETMSCEALS